MVFRLFDNKSTDSGVKSMSNQRELANELHKPIIRKFKRRRAYSSFKDNIWGVDLADMQLISKYNKCIRYLSCAIDLFSKYAWVASLKDKKSITIVNVFQSTLDSSKRKPNKIWVDQGNEFYNSSLKKWLKDNDIKTNSRYNNGKSVVAERFIRTLKNKIFKHMTNISKNVFRGFMLLMISRLKKLLGRFMKKNCKRQIKKKFK